MKQDRSKTFLIHFAGWAFVYAIIGLISGLYEKIWMEDILGVEGGEVIVLWLVLSAGCAPITMFRD